jgi:hypothetical protein
MRGILSDAPAPSAIRLLVGSQLLLLIQAGLVLDSRSTLEPMLCVLVLLVAIIAFSALVAAIAGEPREAVPYSRRRLRHGR